MELPEYSLDMEIEVQTALAVLDRKFYLRGKEAYEANQLENTARIKAVKKDIARVKTALRLSAQQ